MEGPDFSDKEGYDDFADTIPLTDEFLESSSLPTKAPPIEKIDHRRRAFLNFAAAAGVATALPIGLTARLYGEQIVGETIGRNEAERSLQEILERLKNIYGINVDFGQFGADEAVRGIHGEQVKFLTEKREVCEAIEDTLMCYPPAIYKKRAAIKAIKIADNYGDVDQVEVVGQAVKESGNIYLERHEGRSDGILVMLGNIIRDAALSSAERKNKMRWVLHHELMHMIDGVDETRWTNDARGLRYDEEIPANMLPTLYNYELDSLRQNSGLKPEYAEQYKKSFIGFVRSYGKTNGSEDRATIAEDLFVFPKKLKEIIVHDPLLGRKVDFMKKEYFTMSQGVMDEGYWNVMLEHSENPRFLAEYVRLRSEFLVKLPTEQFEKYVAKMSGGDLTDVDIASWQADIAFGVRP